MDRPIIEAKIAKARQEIEAILARGNQTIKRHQDQIAQARAAIQAVMDQGNKDIGHQEGLIAAWTEMLTEMDTAAPAAEAPAA